ncbi:hypothetical protein D3C87_1566430 [compost metagenome]
MPTSSAISSIEDSNLLSLYSYPTTYISTSFKVLLVSVDILLVLQDINKLTIEIVNDNFIKDEFILPYF